MKLLFIHQNFPGQFRHVVRHLAAQPRHKVVTLGDARNIQGRPALHPRQRALNYKLDLPGNAHTHHYLRDFESAVRRGQTVARVAMDLKKNGFVPDVVVGHPAWGECLFLRDIFPNARQIYYFEYFYRSLGGDVGFDPEFPAQLDDKLKVRVKNVTQLLSLEAADIGLSPTQWQKNRYPSEFHPKINVIHEGVNSNKVCPDPDATLEVDGRVFTRADEVVTYVGRNLEPYRGFHSLMRALPGILEARPKAHVMIVGGDDVSYGRRLPDGQTYRRHYQTELGDRVDWSRVHFLGTLPYERYLQVLRVSSVHLYLTYPFVLSWSMLEAMSAGCLVLGSATPPVEEVIRDGDNGLLVDFFDIRAITARIAEILADPEAYRDIRARAGDDRRKIRSGIDLSA
jgi:glycosyltransferase involved in cell wall biosynthesis